MALVVALDGVGPVIDIRAVDHMEIGLLTQGRARETNKNGQCAGTRR